MPKPRRPCWRSAATGAMYESVAAAAGETVYALAFDPGGGGSVTASHLWEYSVATDAWRQLADPPSLVSNVAVAGGTVVAWVDFPGEASPPVLLYDPTTGAWRPGPANPWVGYTDREVVGLPDGRVVSVEAPRGAPAGANPDPPTGPPGRPRRPVGPDSDLGRRPAPVGERRTGARPAGRPWPPHGPRIRRLVVATSRRLNQMQQFFA